VDLLILADPIKLSDVDRLEAVHDTPGPRKTKKNDEPRDIDSSSIDTSSISPEKGGDGGEIDGTAVKKRKGKVTSQETRRIPRRKGRFLPRIILQRRR